MYIYQLSKKENALLKLVERHIFFIRGKKVMVSMHLADLYGIEPRALVQAVKRNKARFPDWMVFQLNIAEFSVLKSQFVISKYNNIRRSLPYAFNEQGIMMLGSVLRSKRAISMSHAITRIFIRPHRLYLKAHSIGGGLW